MLLQPRHTIGADEVHVWHLLADRLGDPGSLRACPSSSASEGVGDAPRWRSGSDMHALQSLLSAQELARMKCYRHERDRTLFLCARGLVRTVLASYLDCTCHDVRFAANDFGKPILVPGDSAGAKLHFNLTHSRGAVALAVSGGREVGIDVEERHRPVEYLALAERFFAEAEARHLRGLDPAELPDAFFAIWTLKEAYVKGIGRGLTFPLEAFCFDLDAHKRLTAFRPQADFVDRDWHFHQFDLGERHCGALAVHGVGATIEMRDWAAAFLR